MKVLEKIIPAALFAWYALGFLLGDLLNGFVQTLILNTEQVLLYLILSSYFTFLLFLYYFQFWKVLWLCIGLTSCYAYSNYFKPEPKRFITQEKLIEYSNLGYSVKIKPLEEIKKGYREAVLQLDGSNMEGDYYMVVKDNSKKDYHINSVHCSIASLRAIVPNEKFSDFYSFLKNYGNYYLNLPKNKCTVVDTQIDRRKLLKFRVEEILERGGITDYSKDISMGLVFGDSSYLDSDFKKKAREGGILHLFAASGLHIGILIGFLLFLLQKIGFGYYSSRVTTILVAFIYLYLLNFPVSLTRAYGFAFYMVLAQLTFRKTYPMDIMLVSSLVIRVFTPDNYWNVSFLLSFGAVGGILFFKEDLDVLLFKKWKNIILENLTLSISASIGTFPVLVYYFHSFSFGSILVNLVLIPLTSFILPLLYTSILLEFSNILYLKDIFWSYTDLLLRVMAYLSDSLGTNLGFYKELGDSNILYYLFVILLVQVFLLLGIVYAIDKYKDKMNLLFYKVLRTSISAYSIAMVVCFFWLGYQYSDTKVASLKEYYISFDFFLVKSKENVYIGGSCKYNSYFIKNIIENGFCKNTKTVYLENEGCLKEAFHCSKSLESVIEANGNWFSEWKDTFPEVKWSNKPSDRFFSLEEGKELIIFYPDKDSIYELINRSKKGKGEIAIVFPYKSKDNLNDWNSNKKLLGINPEWSFVGVDEL